MPDPTEDQLKMETGVYSTVYASNKHPVSDERAKFIQTLKLMCPVLNAKSPHNCRTRSGVNAVVNLNKWTSAAKVPMAVYRALQAQMAMVSPTLSLFLQM